MAWFPLGAIIRRVETSLVGVSDADRLTLVAAEMQARCQTPEGLLAEIAKRAEGVPLGLVGGRADDDLEKLKVGRDEFSRLDVYDLILAMGETLAYFARPATRDDEKWAAALRWVLRGLRPDLASRKAEMSKAAGRRIAEKRRRLRAEDLNLR